MTDNESLDGELTALFSSSAIVFGGELLSKAIRFGAFIVVTKALGVPEFGALSLALVVFQITSSLSLFGQNNTPQRFLPVQSSRGAKRDVARKSLYLTTASSVIVAVAVIVLAEPLAQLLETPELVPVLWVGAITLPFTAFYRAGVAITRALEMTKPRVYLDNALYPLSRFTLVAAVALTGLGVVGMMSAYLVSYVVVALATLYFVVRAFRSVSTEPSGVSLSEMALFSVPLLAFGIISMLAGQVDKFLLGLLATKADVGAFNVVFTLGQHMLIALGSLGYLFTPMFSRLVQESNRTEMIGFYRRVTRWGFYGTTVVAIVFVVFAEPLLSTLFKPAYVRAADTLRVLAFGYLAVAFFGLNDEALLSMGFSRVHGYGAALALLINATLDVLLIPEYGTLGAAVGTVVALVGRELVFAALLYRRSGIHPVTNAMVSPAVVMIVIPVAALEAGLLSAGLPAKLSLASVWATSVAVVVYATGGIDEHDLETVRSMVSAARSRLL